nr:MAG TPA: hypothetical protein [Bacteriophage sp.]
MFYITYFDGDGSYPSVRLCNVLHRTYLCLFII